MSLFTRFNRSDYWETADLPFISTGIQTNSGKRVSDADALKYNVVYSCVDLISSSIAMLSMYGVHEGTSKRAPASLPTWVKKPMPDMQRFDVFKQLVTSKLLWGDAFAYWIRRPSDGVITGFIPLDPASVQVEWNPDRPGFRRYKINSVDGEWLDYKSILHIPGFIKPGDARGMSMIAIARESIGMGLTLAEYGARYFSQGSHALGVIEANASKLNRDEAEYMIRTFESHHRGSKNWHRPAFLTNATYKRLQLPNSEAQFLETRRFEVEEIARWFHMPLHRIQLMDKVTTWGTGIEQENRQYVELTLLPHIIQFEQGLSSHLAGDVEAKFDTQTLLRGSTKERYDAYAVGINSGMLLPDEPRAWEGLDPLPDGLGAKPRPAPNESPDKASTGDTEPDEGDDDADEPKGSGLRSGPFGARV